MTQTEPSVAIRHPAEQEREQLALLTANTFRNELAEARRWVERTDLSEILCLVENGRIVSSITINGYTAFVGGLPIGMGGVGGVMTSADRQGRGYAGRLLTQGLAEHRRRGLAISSLYPFSHVYYGRLGYALAAEHMVYHELTQQNLPRYEEFRMVDRWMPGEPLGPLTEAHNRIMRRYNLCCLRLAEQWEKFLTRLEERKSFLYVIRDRGRIVGWFNAANQRGSNGHESQTWAMALDGRTAFKAMLGMLARLPSMVKKISLHVPPDFELWDELKEPTAPTRQPDFQARVVDLAAALKQRGYRQGAAGNLTFRVVDKQAGWNHATWRARWSGGRLAGLTDRPGRARPGLVADIAPFTQIFCGYRSARELADIGKIEATSPAVLDLLDELFFDRPTHTQDWF